MMDRREVHELEHLLNDISLLVNTINMLHTQEERKHFRDLLATAVHELGDALVTHMADISTMRNVQHDLNNKNPN